MKIYCMADIHGCLNELNQALSLVEKNINDDTKLIFQGDYIHGGYDSIGVLEKIMTLQKKYGSDKVIALLGNHENWLLNGFSSFDYEKILDDPNRENMNKPSEKTKKIIAWLNTLPLLYLAGNFIFVHAGIREDIGDRWQGYTPFNTYIEKYPASVGKIKNLDKIVIAGHVGTREITKNANYFDIYYDKKSHVYIDGSVLISGRIPILMVDTDTKEMFDVRENEYILL